MNAEVVDKVSSSKSVLSPSAIMCGLGLAASTCMVVELPDLIQTFVNPVPSESIASIGMKITSTDMNINRQKLIFSLRSYREFEDDWDGYGGSAPSDEAVEDSIKFLKQLPLEFPLPYSGLSGDGEISLFWDGDGAFIDIGFIGNHGYSYYARQADGKEFFGNDKQVSSELSQDLVSILKSLHS